MSVQTIEEWADARVQTFPLSTLSGAAIGVDASYYLDLCLNKQSSERSKDKPNRDSPKSSLEPLFNALSGIPGLLKEHVENDIQALKKYDISLVFVFNGLDYATKEPSSTSSTANVRAHEEGWQHYLGGHANLTVKTFGKADYPVETLHRYFQNLLTKLGVHYMVAPYSAVAQLSYLEKQPAQYIDAVMTSSEGFLFNIEKVVLDFDRNASTFTWLSRAACQEYLDRASSDLFRDIQLLLGSSVLPTFPLLGRTTSGRVTVRDALGLLNTAGRNVMQLCQQFRDDAQVQNLQYADRYKKAIMTIRHHVVLETNGTVAPLDFGHAPGDVHEFVGQRLPEELFFYLSKGMIGPQIPNWLTSGEVSLTLPAGAQDTDPYRRLVVEQLNSLRASTLKLMSESMNRYYHTRVIKVKPWYQSDNADLTITVREVPAIANSLNGWKIHEEDFPATAKDSMSFLAALRSLQDTSFTKRTLAKADSVPLHTSSEILYNAMWRFLQVRGYVSDNHDLTAWGKALEAALAALGPSDEAEGVLVAIELLRMGLLNGNDISGVIVPPQTFYTHFINLICRVACLGPLKSEKNEGYSGPLDRELLTFAWMITAVRTSLRDLFETIFVCMFLNGTVDRDRSDWSQLACRLPFAIDNGCGLGIVIKTYLDAAEKGASETKDGKPPSNQLREQIKNQEEPFDWFRFVSVGQNLDLAFGLWDAVYAGSQAAGKEFKDAKLFTEANEWLSERR